MRLSSFFVPFFVFLAGIAGFLLRFVELAYVFDPVTGFPNRDALLTTVLFAFSGLVVLAVIIYAIVVVVRYRASTDFDNAFGTDSFLFPFIYTVGGTIWMAASVVFYITRSATGNAGVLDLVFAVLSAISAISIIIFAVQAFKNPRRKIISTLSIISTLFMCLWLVLIYMENASNPILLSYAYASLAVAFVAIGFYFSSSITFGKPIIGKPIVCYAAAAYFCIVTLADNHTLSIRLIIGVLAFISLFNLSLLIRNLQKKIKPQLQPQPQPRRARNT